MIPNHHDSVLEQSQSPLHLQSPLIIMNQLPSTVTMPGDFSALLKTGDFVLFLGAGASVEAGLSDWKHSLIGIADRLRVLDAGYASVIEAEAQKGRFLEAAELFYLAPITPSQRHNILREVFDKQLSITRRLRLLSRVRCQGIVTTNFDRSFQLAANDAHSKLVSFGESDADLAAARVETNPFFLRLHGRIEVPESLIFARRHYALLRTRAQYVAFFRELFLSRNVIFFGFSFADPVISDLMVAMTEEVQSQFRRRAYALVPSPPAHGLLDGLRKSSIVGIPYDTSNNHEEAWALLTGNRTGAPPVAPEENEAAEVRSHLAAAYARAKGRGFHADRERMLSALMLPLLSDAGSNAILGLDDFLKQVEERLALPKTFRRDSLISAVRLLEQDGIVALQGTDLLIGEIEDGQDLERDARRLSQGLTSRARIRFGRPDFGVDPAILGQLVLYILALDGLFVAHTLIRGMPTRARRLEGIVDRAVAEARIRRSDREATRRAVVDLLTSPDVEEERILSNIAAVVFGTALLLRDPLLADSATNPFHRGAYVDASVLLPWLADGHPLRSAYDSLLRSFELTNVRVLPGYLNELVNHRRLAIEAAEGNGLGAPETLRRYVALFELHNVNVFLGGYAGTLQEGSRETFEEYLGRVAPFTTESQVGSILKGLGIVVEDYRPRNFGVAGELKAAFRDRGKFRDDVVIQHDAAQLEVLQRARDVRGRPYFITADRALVGAMAATSFRHLIPSTLLPQQAALLAQMADRNTTGFEAFSRTLWTVADSVADKVKRYYTDRILRQYEEGLVAEVDTILDALWSDFRQEGMDLEAEDISDPHSEVQRARLFERLDRFEPRFFQYLEEALQRSRERE